MARGGGKKNDDVVNGNDHSAKCPVSCSPRTHPSILHSSRFPAPIPDSWKGGLLAGNHLGGFWQLTPPSVMCFDYTHIHPLKKKSLCGVGPTARSGGRVSWWRWCSLRLGFTFLHSTASVLPHAHPSTKKEKSLRRGTYSCGCALLAVVCLAGASLRLGFGVPSGLAVIPLSASLARASVRCSGGCAGMYADYNCSGPYFDGRRNIL
jgi:hypothetical protein